MSLDKKQLIHKLLKGIETGDPEAASVVNEAKYIQHNPQTHEGSIGLAELFKQLSKTSPRVNIVRAFEDGDFVFAHTEYDFATRNIGFEIFRFEEGQAVEHWDNIQKRQELNHSSHTMIDGETEVADHEMTEDNRLTVRSFVDDVLIYANLERLSDYINSEQYVEHSPALSDDLAGFDKYVRDSNYKKNHRILAEGNFVLSVSEGVVNDVPYSFYDLYRLQNGKIVEHWDTRESIPTRSEWKNNNGKF